MPSKSRLVHDQTPATHFDVASAALETTADLPSKLARAFRQLDTEVANLVAKAQLAPAKS